MPTVKELRIIAKKFKIPQYYKLNKKDLTKSIKKQSTLKGGTRQSDVDKLMKSFLKMKIEKSLSRPKFKKSKDKDMDELIRDIKKIKMRPKRRKVWLNWKKPVDDIDMD